MAVSAQGSLRPAAAVEWAKIQATSQALAAAVVLHQARAAWERQESLLQARAAAWGRQESLLQARAAAAALLLGGWRKYSVRRTERVRVQGGFMGADTLT